MNRRRIFNIIIILALLSVPLSSISRSPVLVQAAPLQQTDYTCPCSIWPDPVTPTMVYSNPSAIEMGLKFRSDVSGFVTGVRFFKAAGATGTHIGRLWTMNAELLAEVTFTDETASGWQSANFPTPAAIQANTIYIISYYVADGNRLFALSQNYFASTGVDNDPLQALQNGVDGPNGVYSDTGGFFNQDNLSSNYWVDLIFNDTPDETPPIVSSVSPGNGTTGVLAATNVTVTFDEAMDAASIDTDSFELRNPSNVLVPATITYNSGSNSGVLDPTSNLSFSTIYTAIVKGGITGVTDVSGNPLSVDYTWTFTIEDSDSTPPEVDSVSPAEGATSVATSVNLTATFNEAMNPASITSDNFELRDALNVLVPAAVTYDGGSFSAALNPTSDLNLGTIYTARIISGSTGVKDLAGNTLATDYVWTFTTTGPAVNAVKPIDGVSKLRLATNATVYFNQAMDSNTINVSTFELRDSLNNPVSAAVTYNSGDNSATLDPVSDLNYSTTYIVTVKGGSGGVKDVFNNGMAADYTWTFSTLAQRPSIDQGPGGPILVITSSSNLFSQYFAEILRTEGLNEFSLSDIATVTAGILSGYDIVILGDMALTTDQVSMLTTWVTDGGHLIAMRPDKQLAGLLGLTDGVTTLSNGYLLIDTSEKSRGRNRGSDTPIPWHR